MLTLALRAKKVLGKPVFSIPSNLEVSCGSPERFVDLLIDSLRNTDIYRPDLVYRGAEISNPQEVIRHGTDRYDTAFDPEEGGAADIDFAFRAKGRSCLDFIFASPEHLLLSTDSDSDPMLFAVSNRSECNAALLVYDSRQLHHEYPLYEFRNSNSRKAALRALFVWDK